jgi:hypothetical protein
MVVCAAVANIAQVDRRGVWFESTSLIALLSFLVLAFAKFCFVSYRRGVDDLAERERWLREVETLLMAARVATDSGNRELLDKTLLNTIANASAREGATTAPHSQHQQDSEPTVVHIEDLALDEQADGSLRHSLSLWKARVGEARKSSRGSTDPRNC